MAEKTDLIHRNGNKKDYGSIPYKRLDEDGELRPARFVCTRRDCILVSVLSVFIVAAIATSLAIGLPKIYEKQRQAEMASSVLDGGNQAPNSNPAVMDSRKQDETKSSSAAVVDNSKQDEAKISPSVTDKPTAGIQIANSEAPLNPTVASSNTTETVTNGPNIVVKRAAVVANDPRCSEIGSEMLKLNGSAVDAAIATLLCLEAVNPHHSGIGGGFFMTVYTRANKTAYVLDAREAAPLAATEDMFKGNATLSNTGGLSVAVPGALKGYWDAHQKFGKLAWNTLFQPTIKICREGFRVGKDLASVLQQRRDVVLNEPTLRAIFVNETTGDLLTPNDTMFRRSLAATFNSLANDGIDSFYTGNMSDQLVAEIKAKGGIITKDDFKAYTVHHKKPLEFTVASKTVFGVPPPASGAILAFILHLIEGFNFTSDSIATNDSAILTYHRIAETFKFAYAERTELGDEAFVNVTELIRNLTSPAFAAAIRQDIVNNATFDTDYYMDHVFAPPIDHGTTHVSVVDPNGNAVAVTSTINGWFGAKFRSSLGIIFNNEMDDFSSPNITNIFGVPPSPANFIRPGKRPQSSMSPNIMVDAQGDIVLVSGAAGGTAITTGTSYVLLRHLWFKENVTTANSALRLHHQLFPNILYLEPGFPQVVADGLAAIGHNISYDIEESDVNIIWKRPDGMLEASSEPRLQSGSSGF